MGCGEKSRLKQSRASWRLTSKSLFDWEQAFSWFGPRDSLGSLLFRNPRKLESLSDWLLAQKLMGNYSSLSKFMAVGGKLIIIASIIRQTGPTTTDGDEQLLVWQIRYKNTKYVVKLIINKGKLTMRLIVLALTLIALLSHASARSQVEEFLHMLPYVTQEVDRVIVKDFFKKELSGRQPEELLVEFESFKRQWLDRMVEFLIKELDINEEGATEARKNPDDFYINYDTYKLFVGMGSSF